MNLIVDAKVISSLRHIVQVFQENRKLENRSTILTSAGTEKQEIGERDRDTN